MENNQRQILSEINEIAASIRTQLDILEKKIAELSQLDDNESVDETIDIDMITTPVVEDIVIEPVAEPVIEPAAENVVVEEVAVEEPAAENVVVEDVAVAEPAAENVVVEDVAVEEPVVPVPEPVKEIPEAVHHKVAVIDKMAEHQAWRVDMPGSQVRDVRSAISLNDRLLFINTLFSRDPMLFQDTINIINNMKTLDEAVEYLSSHFTQWNFESDEVYRFMMAVRRRLK